MSRSVKLVTMCISASESHPSVQHPSAGLLLCVEDATGATKAAARSTSLGTLFRSALLCDRCRLRAAGHGRASAGLCGGDGDGAGAVMMRVFQAGGGSWGPAAGNGVVACCGQCVSPVSRLERLRVALTASSAARAGGFARIVVQNLPSARFSEWDRVLEGASEQGCGEEGAVFEVVGGKLIDDGVSM
jgi:hypothetical protein